MYPAFSVRKVGVPLLRGNHGAARNYPVRQRFRGQSTTRVGRNPTFEKVELKAANHLTADVFEGSKSTDLTGEIAE